MTAEVDTVRRAGDRHRRGSTNLRTGPWPGPRRVHVRKPFRIADAFGAHPRLARGDQGLSLAAGGELSAAPLRDGAVKVHVQGAEPLLRRLQAPECRARLSAVHVDPGAEQLGEG